MDLRDYTRTFRDRWVLLVGGIVLGVLVAGLLATLLPQRYASESSIYLSSPAGSQDPAVVYQGDQLAQERAGYYVPLVTQARITDAVAARVGDGLDARDIAERVVAVAPAGTPLIVVSVSDTSPQRAQAVAAATADALVKLVADVEASTNPATPPGVIATIVQPATFQPRTTSVPIVPQVALGALVGLIAGAAVALVRESQDRSVTSPGELRSVTRLPVLSAVGRDPRFDRRPLTTAPDVPRQRVEAFRQLRTSMDLLGPRGRRVVVFTSARAGEGSTSTVANFAIALSRAGRSVAVVDANLRSPRLARLLDVADADVGLAEVLRGELALTAAMRPSGNGSVSVLPAGRSLEGPAELLLRSATAEVLGALGRVHDWVLVDTPPVLPVTDATVLATHADAAVVVVARGRASDEDLREVLEALRVARTPIVGTVFTHARVDARIPDVTEASDAGRDDALDRDDDADGATPSEQLSSRDETAYPSTNGNGTLAASGSTQVRPSPWPRSSSTSEDHGTVGEVAATPSVRLGHIRLEERKKTEGTVPPVTDDPDEAVADANDDGGSPSARDAEVTARSDESSTT